MNHTADFNPFAAPESTDECQERFPKRYRVASGALVVRSGAVLPQYSAFTNRPVSASEMTTTKLSYVDSDAKLIAIFMTRVGLPFFLLNYTGFAHSIEITYGFETDARSRYFWGFAIAFCLMVCEFVVAAAFEGMPVRNSGLLFALCCIFLITFFAVGYFYIKAWWQLMIFKRIGNEFWVTGFNKDFLKRIDEPMDFSFLGSSPSDPPTL